MPIKCTTQLTKEFEPDEVAIKPGWQTAPDQSKIGNGLMPAKSKPALRECPRCHRKTMKIVFVGNNRNIFPTTEGAIRSVWKCTCGQEKPHN